MMPLKFVSNQWIYTLRSESKPTYYAIQGKKKKKERRGGGTLLKVTTPSFAMKVVGYQAPKRILHSTYLLLSRWCLDNVAVELEFFIAERGPERGVSG